MMDDPDARSFAVEKYREFVATIEVRWTLWLNAIGSLTDAEILSPGTCGEWSVKDMIAHVAVWDEVATEKIGDITSGLTSDSMETTDEFNQRNSLQYRDTPFKSLMTMMHVVHKTLIETLDRMSVESNGILERVEWAVVDDTSKHYLVHESQIRQRFQHV